MKVLVHYDAFGNRPLGIWWLDPDEVTPKCEYLVPDGPDAVRGKLLVFSKTNPDLPWPEWFDRLTTHSPYFEDWAVYDSKGKSGPDFFKSLLSPAGVKTAS